MDPSRFAPLGNNFLSVGSGVVGLGTGFDPQNAGVNAIPVGATHALIVVEGTAPINWRDDGVAPAASDGGGIPLSDSTPYYWYPGNLSAFKLIASTGTIKVSVSFYKAVG